MQFKCEDEAVREDGTKIMEFTKGCEYTGVEDSEGGFYIEDDEGNMQHFFDFKVLFEKL
jgi:hypothetical protein